MLTRPLPSRRRLTAGFALTLGLGITAAGLAWAHQPPQIAVTDAAPEKPTPATEAPAASPMNRAPSILAVMPPRYPRSALAQGIEGTSMVFVQIRADGTVTEARIERSSGNEALDAAALDVVRQWTFNPERRNGEAIGSSLRVPIEFSLGHLAADEGKSDLPPSAR
jgi:protein TonB